MNYESITSQLKHDLKDAILREFPDVPVEKIEVSMPTDRNKADLVTSIAFQLAKAAHMSPMQISQKIVERLREAQGENPMSIAEAAAPGFINFRLSDKELIASLENIKSEGENYGRNDTLKGQRWVIEHTSPNPNKAMHVGHLRNNLIGMSVANIAEFSGAEVVRDGIDNDRGIAIARAMWGFLKYKHRDGNQNLSVADWVADPNAWLTPGEVGAKPDHFVGDCYAKAAHAAKDSEQANAEIRQMAVDWEDGDPDVWKLWKLVLDYAHEGIYQTLDRLGNHWDVIWHEHEHYKDGREMVLAGIEKGTFKRLDDGAVLTDLSSYNLPDTIVLKSDGTSLYITQDIALTRLKKERFNADKLFWVIGPEQSVAMKQVFAICEQLGIGKFDDFIHLPYGLVNITDESGSMKKMSSRDGNTIYIDQLIDEVKSELLGAERGYQDSDAETIAVDAVKFALLKPSRTSNTVINIDETVSLKGDSGVYVLYTLARMNSLLKRFNGINAEATGVSLTEGERRLAVDMTYFPRKVKDALDTYAPNVLTGYLIELAHDFNSLYAKEQFISDDPSATANKLLLTQALVQVFTNALLLLGIVPVSNI